MSLTIVVGCPYASSLGNRAAANLSRNSTRAGANDKMATLTGPNGVACSLGTNKGKPSAAKADMSVIHKRAIRLGIKGV